MGRHAARYKFTDVSEVLAACINRALLVEEVGTSEPSVEFYQTGRRNVPEESNF
jgi:hypothetical protein